MRGSWLHPNGVLPEGNILFAGGSNREGSVRADGLGLLQRLSDSLIADVLALCDGQSLARCSKVSKVLYVFCQLDYLWRDLVLLRTKGEGISFQQTWRDTYKHLIHPSHPCHSSPGPQILLTGFYSQFLFHSWLCAHYEFDDVAPGFLRHEDIPRVSAKNLTVERFIEDYEIPNRPVIIVDALSEQWPALTSWSEEYLIAHSGAKPFRARSTAAVMPAHFTMKEYLQYASQVQEESPLYLFERRFADVGQLGADYKIPDYFNPEEFEKQGLTKSKGYDTDLFRLLGERRPDHRWMVVGPRKSGSIFHVDPNQTNAWNVCVQGRKKWIFYPPDVQPPGVQSSPDGGDVIVPVSIAEWLINFWSFHQEARCHKDPSKRPLEAVLHPGEIIFVPHGYWHMVVNLDFSVALTHNYVSTSNLFSCLKFLRFKPDQISGVRDHYDGEEVCAADDFYSYFTERLSEYFPANHPIYSHCMQRIESLANNSKKSVKISEVEGGEGEGSRKRKGGAVSSVFGDSDRATTRPRNSHSPEEEARRVDDSPSTTTFRFDFF